MRSPVTSSISRGREFRNLKIKDTFDLIRKIENGLLPDNSKTKGSDLES